MRPFYSPLNGLHDKETTGPQHSSWLSSSGRQGPVLISTVLGQLMVCAVRSTHSGIKMLMLPLTSCVALGKLLYFAEPQFLHL